MAAPVPGRCGFFVKKKQRFCKMIVAKDKKFCGEHATMDENSSIKRIVCPLDPKHTVCEDKLQKHLKKCNSREKPKPVYYVQDINAGSAEGDEQIQVSLCERSRSQLQSLVDKLKKAVEGLQCDLDDRFLSHPVFEEELHNPKNGESAHKHLKQQSSLLAHMDALGLLGRGRCFVEFGAGKGKLSHWIHEALKTSMACPELKTHDLPKTSDEPKSDDRLQFLLVERSSTRFKVDGKHQETGVQFERLQVDIQHLDLSKVPLLSQQLPLVGVGKHLCGAATDLSLRCLLDTPGLTEEPPSKRQKTSGQCDLAGGGTESSRPGPVLGMAVALCCHHRCEWRHYVGQRFFQQRGLGAEEFEAFSRMSSWATCGLRVKDGMRDEDEHEPAEETDAVNGFLSAGERHQVGRLCKLLIDGGRLHFLQSRGFSGKLTRYISSDVTLENVMLTAVPSTATS
ncbi:tRNA:m(4)X modification enzyme TRM13 homolog [Neosynchiropus ocellatus]